VVLPPPLAAAVVGDRALIATGTLRAADPTSLTLAVATSRGVVQSIREYPGLLADPSSSAPQLHGIDDTSAFLATQVASTTLFGFKDIRLQRVDADGNLVGAPSTVILSSEVNIASAWDGQALWLLWRSQNQFLLRPYALDGSPLAAAQVIDSQAAGQLSLQRMVAAGGRVLITWMRNDVGTAHYRYAIVQGVGVPADVRTLGTGDANTNSFRALQPVLSSGVVALQWIGPIFSQLPFGTTPDSLPRGVTLDASWNARRSTSGNLDDELLPAAWAGPGQPVLMSALGDRLVVASFVGQRQIPELFSPSDFVLGTFLQSGSAPLATAGVAAAALANKSGSLAGIDLAGPPRFLLQWQDRALVIGDNMISLFWLR
jgi:hypothetical protein